MKKPKNKFILLVIGIISFIILSQVYIAFSNVDSDTNSYITLVQGKGTMNENLLKVEERIALNPGDTIRVIGETSFAIIEWGDGSLTRLGGNTKIIIQENEIERDYSKINISFQLIAGKTWSNVVSFIGNDSSFTQNFQGIEAGVRGTIFDVDLERSFIHVSDHQVELRGESGKKLLVSEGTAIDLSDLSLIDIEKFLKDVQDLAWVELNERFDREYISYLKQALQDSLDQSNPFLYILPHISTKHHLLQTLSKAEKYSDIQDIIDTIPDSDREEMYAVVMSKYQNINFVGAGDYQFYKRKIFYKKALIALGKEQDSEILLRSSAYDLQDIFEIGNIDAAQETLLLLHDNSQFLPTFKDLLPSIDSIPLKFRQEFQQGLQDFEGLLDFDFFQGTSIKVNDLEQRARESIRSIDAGAQNLFQDTVGNLVDQISR